MGAARFTILSDQCVRMEYAPGGEAGGFVDWPSLTASERRGGRPVVVQDVAGARPVELRTSQLELVFAPRGVGLTAESLRVRVRGPFAPGGPSGDAAEWKPGARQTANLGGTLSTLDGLKHAAALPDGLLSRDGWFLIDDSCRHLLVDGWVKTREEMNVSGNTDWYLLCYGADYGAALRAFTGFAGRVPMPRRCLLGSWYSRYWPHTSADYRKIVAEYDEHGVPLDVMVLDMDWHRDGWTGWSWNRDLLPDAERLLHWMHEQGLAVTLNLHPADGVGPHEDRYAEFMRALGRDPSSREVVKFDAGDRAYMRALFEHVHKPLENEGVDFWWLDWQQQKFVPSVPGLTNLAWLNQLYFDHTRSGGRRGVSFSRWAGHADNRIDTHEHLDERKPSPQSPLSGRESQALPPPTSASCWSDHRHPIHFSGDAHTGWEMLAYQVPFTAVAGNAGCFFWSHDIGGHFGPRLEETTARWVQFGALSAALRLHSARTEALNRRPWSCAQPFFESMRAAFEMRAALMPYIYTQVRACHERSLPLLRPMYVDRPIAREAYESPRQYMLGEHLLVAPIIAPGLGARYVARREVWFPPLGEPQRAWYRWGTDERHGSGSHAIVSAAIDEAPLFVPGGVPIALQGRTRRMTSGALTELVVRVWPGAPGFLGESELYEDDGISRAHEQGAFARTPLRVEWMPGRAVGGLRARVTIGPTVGSFEGQLKERAVRIEFAGAASIEIAANDAGNAQLRKACEQTDCRLVFVPTADIRRAIVVEVEMVPTETQASVVRHAARRFGAAFDWALAANRSDLDEVLRDAAIAHGLNHAGKARAARIQTEADAAAAIGLGIAVVKVETRPDLNVPPTHARLIDSRGLIDEGAAQVEIIDDVGRAAVSRWSGRVVLNGLGEPAGSPRSAEIALPDKPLSPPPIGVRATRSVRAEFHVGGRPMVVGCVVETSLSPITEWHVAGPFDWHWATSITRQSAGPEHGGLGEHDRHTGADGASVGWCAARSSAKWKTDFAESLPDSRDRSSALGYAVTHISSARSQPARLHIESSDKLEVWVNGAKVYSMDSFESPAAVEGGAEIKLRAGRNTLLVKCASGGIAGVGGWGFTALIEGESSVSVDPHDSRHDRPGHPSAG